MLSFRSVRVPLSDFDLELDLQIRRRAFGIFGPSGAGKTTLLELVAGLRRPSSGTVKLDDEILDDPAGRVHVPARRRRVGYVPQDAALFPHLDVRHNVEYALARAGGDASPDVAHIVEVLELDGLLDRRPATLSGGERQRVALARALVSGPRILLLDEPLGGLDTSLKRRVLACLIRVRDEFDIPMLLVSHDADDVTQLCEELLVLDAGRVVAQGGPRDVLRAEGMGG